MSLCESKSSEVCVATFREFQEQSTNTAPATIVDFGYLNKVEQREQR